MDDNIGENSRKDLRIEICKDMLVDTFLINGAEIKSPKKLRTKIVNLSSNGLMFVTQLDIPENISLMCTIQTDKEVIAAKANIIHKRKGNDEYSYGCKFLDLSSIEQQLLRRYIYKEQLGLLSTYRPKVR